MFLVTHSKNTKIGNAAATYAPIKQTCPASCPLRDKGCYAQVGHVGMQSNRLADLVDGLNGDTIAILEAAEIRDNTPRWPLPLRLHVSGDAGTPFRARTLSDAAKAWNGPVWSYTHAWRDVPRESWGRVSILASCERPADANAAMDQGYAAALVTPPHPADGRAYELGGVRVIPCPNQTRGVQCSDCGLCFDDARLLASRSVIGFEIHGAPKKRALNVIQA